MLRNINNEDMEWIRIVFPENSVAFPISNCIRRRYSRDIYANRLYCQLRQLN